MRDLWNPTANGKQQSSWTSAEEGPGNAPNCSLLQHRGVGGEPSQNSTQTMSQSNKPQAGVLRDT